MKLLHKYHIPLHVFTFAVTALAIIMVVSPFVRATGEYQASDMLGHLPVNYVPTFTQGTPDSNLPIAAPSTNRFGLHDPTATALDPVNHLLYVADIQNNRVLVYQLNGANRQTSLNATYVLGQPNMLSSTQATTRSGMDSPRAIAVDTANQRVFVVEYDNNRVLVYDTSGGITNGMNASYVLGQADFTSNGQGAGQTGFTTPRGVGYDPVNELVFVADTGNHRVLVYDARDSGSPDRTLCGTTTNGIANGMNASCVFGQPDFATTSFGTSINKMYFPRGISFSSVDGGTYEFLFVADTNNNRILIYELKIGFENGMDALMVVGQPDFDSNTASATQQGLSSPRSAEMFGDNFLIVADYGNNRVLVYNRLQIQGAGANAPALFVLGQGTVNNFTGVSSGTTRNTFSSPFFITTDYANNNVFITDYGNNRVLEWTFQDLTGSSTTSPNMDYVYGQVIRSSYGSPDYTASGQNNSQSFSSPDPYPNEVGFAFGYDNDGDVAIDSARNKLYVSDGHNNRVLVYNLDSNKNLIDRIPDVVLGQPNFYSMSAGQGANGMTSPTCLDIDETRGYLFVCDKGNQRILVFDVSGGATDHMNASYVLGQTSLVSTTLDTTPTQDRIGEPVALAYDPSSVAKDLYVIDGANNRLLSFDTATLANGISAAHILNASTFNYSASINANDPYRGLAIDTARHYLYVGRFDGTTTSDVAVYNVTTGPSNNMTPFATTNTFTGDVQGLSYSSTSQSLFVSNSSEHRVYVYDFFTITNGEDPEGVLGQNSFSTNTPGTSQGQFGNPIGSVFDEINRRLYLIDSYNSRVLIYNFISLDTPSLPSGNVGTPYSATLTAQNYQGVYFFIEAIAGSLPPGISINISALVGTPTTSGTYNFTLRSYDEFGVSKFYSNQHDTLITIADADPLPYLASYVLYQPDFISGSLSLTQPKVVFDEINHRVFVSNGTQATISSFDLDASNNFPDFISDGQLGTGVMTPSNNSFGSDTTGLYGGITPIALAVDSTHQRLFVSDSNRVLVFDVTSGINSSNTAVNILGGQPDYNSNNVLPVAQNTSTATALAYDESRQVLFVADGTRIAVFDVAPAGSRTITLCGNTTNGIVDNMNASCVLDWSGSGGFITELALDEARGLLFAINASGFDLAVFDVRQAGSPAVTICGNSSTGIANGQTPLCPTAWWGTYLSSYAYIAYDKGRQQLFFNDNIGTLIFDVSDLSTGLPATPRAVLGRFDANAYTVMLNTPNQASLGNMTFGVPAVGGVVDAGNNRYYVADAGYDRIMIFNFVEITTPSLPAGTVGSAYSQTLATANSQGTVSFAVTGGALPAGLSLSSGGIISGTPTTAGTYSVTIQATDAFPNASNFISSAKTFTIQVNDVVVTDLCPNIAGNQPTVPSGMVVDSFGNCVTPTSTTDLCPNISGDQATVPSGMIIDGSGNCVPGGGGPSWCQDPLASNFGGPLPCTYPGADLCPNIAGTQLTIPSGMYIDLSGNCVSSGGPDLCPNISGVQVVVPSGYIVDGFGNCVEPPPVDLCPNIVGSQPTVPSGMYIDSFGNCVTPTSTTDLCPNISGDQATVPVGMVLDSFGNCVTPTSTTDLCPNIAGNQVTVPSGMTIDSFGNCVTPTSTTDLCPNIAGDQATIPSGMVIDTSGDCVPTVTTGDLCPNIAGNQPTVPSGMVVDIFGNCVTPTSTTDLCPNIAGDQSTVPSGLIIDVFGDCVDPSASVDLCPNIAGTQSTVPSGMVLDSSGDCVIDSTTTDLCPNIAGDQSTIPIDYTIDLNGDCVPTTGIDVCPNIAGDQSVLPPGLIFSAGNCVIPPVDLCTVDPASCGTSSCPSGICPATSTPPLSGPGGVATTIGLITAGIAAFAKRLSIGKIKRPKLQSIWPFFLIAFGIKKRERPWGTVYDSVTKEPLDPVTIELINKEGKVVSTAVTDKEGRYGFMVPPGMYALRPYKEQYIFPSLILGHLTQDEVYKDLYFGKYFEIKKEGELIARNIPMDPVHVDKEKQIKADQRILKFFSKRNTLLLRIADILFFAGLVFTVVAVVTTPILFNFIVLGLYGVMVVIRFTGIAQSDIGIVYEGKERRPVSNATIRVYSAVLGNEVVRKITDSRGRFYCLVPNGKYFFTIERTPGIGVPEIVYESIPFEVTKGILKGHWRI